MVESEPPDEEAHYVIGANTSTRCVHDDVSDIPSLFFSFSFIPDPESLTNERYVLRILDSFLYLLAQSFKSARHFPNGYVKSLQFRLVLLEPLALQRVFVDLGLVRLVGRGGTDESTDPRDTT